LPRERVIHAQDGLALFLTDWGDPAAPRLPLLCLHGLTRNGKDFATLATRESARRRVLCPDYRGRGRSAYDPNWRNYRPEVLLDDLRHTLIALGIHRFVVVGTSMGGLLAWALTVLMPTAVAGIVINDIGPQVDGGGSRRILDFVSVDRPQPDWDGAVAELKRFLPTLSIRHDADWLRLARNTYREGDDGRLHFDWDVNLTRPLLADPTGGGRDLWVYFRAARALPMLVIRGGVSDILSAATLDRMVAEKPDLVHLTLPGVGHTPTLEEPQVCEALDDFLSRF